MNDGGNQYTIGAKIRDLRLKNGLTQEELADRAELSKGFISQLENDLTSPSIATLTDILTLLGTTLSEFFSVGEREQLVFAENDYFEKTSDGITTKWIVPTAQKNDMEPIIVELAAGAVTDDRPHDGEEFGYVLCGEVEVSVGDRVARAKAGESFYYSADRMHGVKNVSSGISKFLWVSCPPSF